MFESEKKEERNGVGYPRILYHYSHLAFGRNEIEHGKSITPTLPVTLPTIPLGKLVRQSLTCQFIILGVLRLVSMIDDSSGGDGE